MFESIIDPTLGSAIDSGRGPFELAKRPESLAGLRLGLLTNPKHNAAEFLDDVADLLVERYGMQKVLTTKKFNIRDAAPEETREQLREACDVVVTGVGDCGSCSASAVADGLLLEQCGLPAVVICSDAFEVSANAMADVQGAHGYRYVTTAHPVANLSREGVRERAEQAVAQIVSMLTVPAMAGAA